MSQSSNWRGLRKLLHRHKKDQPRIIKRKNHSLSGNEISPNASKVLYCLNSSGYEAYLVGGGVRDMLLGLHPKDFDIVTNARPQQIRKLFRNSRLIGRRFLLVHVYFPNEIIEVSTFRANVEEFIQEEPLTENKNVHKRIFLENNTYGTIEEDAWRRDFTVNALYYNITNFSVVDFTDGMKDLNKRVIRMIGDPIQRYHEDPVRLLRAIRLAAKLDFNIHPETKESLQRLHNLLHHVPSARIFTEVLKIFFKGHALRSYQWLLQTGYMQTLFPGTVTILKKTHRSSHYKNLFEFALKATDQRHNKNQTLNPGFLFAIFLWPTVQELVRQYFKKYKRLFPSIYHGINIALRQQMETLIIPRRLTTMMRSVWLLQYHLERRRYSRIYHIAKQRFFRAAFDFLELREQAGEPLKEIVHWWQAFRDGNQKQHEQLINELNGKV